MYSVIFWRFTTVSAIKSISSAYGKLFTTCPCPSILASTFSSHFRWFECKSQQCFKYKQIWRQVTSLSYSYCYSEPFSEFIIYSYSTDLLTIQVQQYNCQVFLNSIGVTSHGAHALELGNFYLRGRLLVNATHLLVPATDSQSLKLA